VLYINRDHTDDAVMCQHCHENVVSYKEYLKIDEFYVILKCLACLLSAANLVNIDANFAKIWPKVKWDLYGPPGRC